MFDLSQPLYLLKLVGVIITIYQTSLKLYEMLQAFYKAKVMLVRPSVRTYLRTDVSTLSGLVDAYKRKVSLGQISYNEAQMTIVNLMEKLNVNITEYSSNLVARKLACLKKEDYKLPVPKGF